MVIGALMGRTSNMFPDCPLLLAKVVVSGLWAVTAAVAAKRMGRKRMFGCLQSQKNDSVAGKGRWLLHYETYPLATVAEAAHVR